MEAPAGINLGPQEEKRAAEEATRAFLSSIVTAVQTPLAPKNTKRRAPAPSATPTILRRSNCIARTESISNVRPSKCGEALIMRKLGLVPTNAEITKEAQDDYE